MQKGILWVSSGPCSRLLSRGEVIPPHFQFFSSQGSSILTTWPTNAWRSHAARRRGVSRQVTARLNVVAHSFGTRISSFLCYVSMLMFALLPALSQQAPYQSQDPTVTIIPGQIIGTPKPSFQNPQQEAVFNALLNEYSLEGVSDDSGRVERLVDTLLAQIGATVLVSGEKRAATIPYLFGTSCRPGPALLLHIAIWHVDPAALTDGKTPRTFALEHSEWHGYQWKPAVANLAGSCRLLASGRSDGSPSFLGSNSIYVVGLNAFDSQMYGSRVTIDYKLSQTALLPANFADVATALSALTGIQLATPASAPNPPSAPVAIDNGTDAIASNSPATLMVNVSQSVVPTWPVTVRSLVPTSVAPYSINASFFLQFQTSPLVVAQGQKLDKPGADAQGSGGQSDTTIYLPDHLEQLLGKENPIGLGPLPPGLFFHSDLEAALESFGDQTIEGQIGDAAREHLAALTAAVATEKFEEYALLAAQQAAQPVHTLQVLFKIPPPKLLKSPEAKKSRQNRNPGPPVTTTSSPAPMPASSAAGSSAADPCPEPEQADLDVTFGQSPLDYYLCHVQQDALKAAARFEDQVKQEQNKAESSVQTAQDKLQAALQKKQKSEAAVKEIETALKDDQTAVDADTAMVNDAQANLNKDQAAQDTLPTEISNAFSALLSTTFPSGTVAPKTVEDLDCSAISPSAPAASLQDTDQSAEPSVPAVAPQAASQPASVQPKSAYDGARDTVCTLRQELPVMSQQTAADRAVVTSAGAKLTADQDKLKADENGEKEAITQRDTIIKALGDSQATAQTATKYADAVHTIYSPLSIAMADAQKSAALLATAQQAAQCIVIEMRLIRRGTEVTKEDVDKCPTVKSLEVSLASQGRVISESRASALASSLHEDVRSSLMLTDSRLRQIDGFVKLINRAVNESSAIEQTMAREDTKPAPPPAPPNCCCCQPGTPQAPAGAAQARLAGASAQVNTGPSVVQAFAHLVRANDSQEPAPMRVALGGLGDGAEAAQVPGGPAPLGANPVPAHPDPKPVRGAITGVSFRAGDFPLLLVLHSPTPPYIPDALPIGQTAPAPPRPVGYENACTLPTERGYDVNDIPCVEFISLTSSSGSSPSGGGGGGPKGQGAGPAAAGAGTGAGNTPGGPNASSALSPSQPVDCSRQSSASGVCSYSRLFTVDEPEWWDISLGLAIPGVKEKISNPPASPPASGTTPPISLITPCPAGYTCSNKHHADPYIFVDFYPFARAWAPRRRALFTNISYAPHVAVGVPLTSQSLYRPFFGLSEHVTGWVERRGLFPIGVSIYGGTTWMKENICDAACIAMPTTPLPYQRVWRPSFGAEVSITAIASKLTKSGGAAGAKSQSAGGPKSH